MNELSLRNLRKNKKMSQKKLAEKLFVPVATIRKWEENKALPSIQDIFLLEKVLEVKNDDIIKIFRAEQTLVGENFK